MLVSRAVLLISLGYIPLSPSHFIFLICRHISPHTHCATTTTIVVSFLWDVLFHPAYISIDNHLFCCFRTDRISIFFCLMDVAMKLKTFFVFVITHCASVCVCWVNKPHNHCVTNTQTSSKRLSPFYIAKQVKSFRFSLCQFFVLSVLSVYQQDHPHPEVFDQFHFKNEQKKSWEPEDSICINNSDRRI